jgi:hypothetical protein
MNPLNMLIELVLPGERSAVKRLKKALLKTVVGPEMIDRWIMKTAKSARIIHHLTVLRHANPSSRHMRSLVSLPLPEVLSIFVICGTWPGSKLSFAWRKRRNINRLFGLPAAWRRPFLPLWGDASGRRISATGDWVADSNPADKNKGASRGLEIASRGIKSS